MLSKRKIIILQLVLIISILCFSRNNSVIADQNHDEQRILQSASELDYPPFAIVKPDGTADGFSVELLKAVAKAVNLGVNISVGPWHEIKQQLSEGRLDVLPLVSYNTDRDKVFDFTVPYLQMHGTIFVRNGENSILSETDLKDKEVMVMREDTAHEYAVNNNLSSKLILTTSFEEAMRLLSSGKHDAVFCQYLMGLQLIKKLGITNIVSVSTKGGTNLKPREGIVSGFEQKFCLAVPEGKKELLALLNEGLAIVNANGTYDKLYNKWFSPILPHTSISLTLIIKYLLLTLIPILFLMATVSVWYLRREIARKTSKLNLEIQEHKRADEALQVKTNFLDKIIASSALSMWISDEKGTAIRANRACLEFFGATEEEVIGKYNLFQDAVIEKQGYLPIIKEVFEKGEPASIIIDYDFGAVGHVEVKNATHKIIRSVFTPVLNNDGKVTNVISQAIDLTEMIQKEGALRKSEERYRLLYANTPAMLHSIDRSGLLVDVSETWLEKLGYLKEEVIGRKSSDFLSEESRRYASEEVLPEFFQNGYCKDIQYTFVKKNGEELDVLLSAIAEKDDEGNIIRSLAVLEDVTEKHRLEAQLSHAHKMEAIGTLAGGIAHDFNNILTAIFGNIELAKMKADQSNPIYEHLEAINNSAIRSKDLVQQILTFSRKTEIDKYPLRVDVVLKEAMKLLRSSIPTTIDIEEDITSRGTVLADPTQLHQIIMNLCTNAYHAMREKGGTLGVALREIDITSKDIVKGMELTPGRYLQLEVSDTGRGMSQKIKDKIFDPYFTTKESGGGTGLGLAVVHGIVKGHNGHITVYSKPDQGTTFRVYLPASEAEVKKEETALETESLAGSEHLMFVDDEESNATLAKEILTKYGYQVDIFTNGVEAWQKIQKQPDKYDLVITDMTMPFMTGTELAQKIIEIRPNLPIILCTGYSEMINREKALAMGISEYMQKPMAMSRLVKSVRQVLDKREKPIS